MLIRQVFWFEFIDFQLAFIWHRVLTLKIKDSRKIQVREVMKNSS